ncbi:MAG: lysophospholipid acyltransferase family protein [Tannerella sp.]|jgi:KDO2-lipid IV(A) lauroyltransferase|nr:lysophospholipid acyltransferase family protein [Tannerella sp.]
MSVNNRLPHVLATLPAWLTRRLRIRPSSSRYGYGGLYMFVYLPSLLPMSFLYGLSSLAYLFLFHLLAYRKTVVIQNLSRSFPEKKYTEIESITKAFYRLFCDNLVEIVKSASIPAFRQKEKVRLIGFEKITNQLGQGKHVIASMGHCGNWEILNVLPSLFDANMYAVYKPLSVKCVDRLFLKIRSRFGMNLIPDKSIARHFMSNRNPALYFFLADQCPVAVNEAYRFDFLHQKTSVFSGVEKLARKANACVVYLHTVRISRGLYRIECKDITTDSRSTGKTDITRRYVHLLEQNIREHPGGWLWSHKRWKR